MGFSVATELGNHNWFLIQGHVHHPWKNAGICWHEFTPSSSPWRRVTIVLLRCYELRTEFFTLGYVNCLQLCMIARNIVMIGLWNCGPIKWYFWLMSQWTHTCCFNLKRSVTFLDDVVWGNLEFKQTSKSAELQTFFGDFPSVVIAKLLLQILPAEFARR